MQIKSLMKQIIKINQITIVITFSILLIDLLIFLVYDKSISGYLFERCIYFYTLILSICFLTLFKIDNKFKQISKLILIVSLVYPFIYILTSYKIGTNDEIKLNRDLKIRQSISIETSNAISIYQNCGIFEKEISRWNSGIIIDSVKYRNLKEIDSAKIIEETEKNYLIAFYKGMKVGNEQFEKKNIR
jgi:hypothetical protein